MAKWQYQHISFRQASLKMIEVINSIIEEYRELGFILTARQLYYQLVARDFIPNNQRSYKTITRLVNDGKLAGLIDWDMLEDRTRAFKNRHRFADPQEVLKAAEDSYHIDMWEGQEVRIYCIVEKEALYSVLAPVCRQFDVPLLAARGYPSGTVLREFVEKYVIPNKDQKSVILHLGDHDPSGIDMTRDLDARIDIFTEGDYDFELYRLALNLDQVKEKKPPENPAKTTDSRFSTYTRKFGKSSWELDALDPTYLQQVLREPIESFINKTEWEKRQSHVIATKQKLAQFRKTYKES